MQLLFLLQLLLAAKLLLLQLLLRQTRYLLHIIQKQRPFNTTFCHRPPTFHAFPSPHYPAPLAGLRFSFCSIPFYPVFIVSKLLETGPCGNTKVNVAAGDDISGTRGATPLFQYLSGGEAHYSLTNSPLTIKTAYIS